MWGYIKDKDGSIIIDEELKPFIRKIYNMYEQGHSFTSIGEYLIKSGVYIGNLNAAKKQVRTVISRSEYAGNYDKDSYPYKQIISIEQYKRCTEEIRNDKTKFHYKVKRVSLCKGLLYSKRGHYYMTGYYKYDKVENYYFWSSGPWHK